MLPQLQTPRCVLGLNCRPFSVYNINMTRNFLLQKCEYNALSKIEKNNYLGGVRLNYYYSFKLKVLTYCCDCNY